MCMSAGQEGRKGTCKKRGIVYETYCLTCGTVVEEGEEEETKLDSESTIMKKCKKETTERGKKKVGDHYGRNGKLKEYKYKNVGETSRPGFEKGMEHDQQREGFNEGSPMLKHCLMVHANRKPSEVKFGMRLRSKFKTPLERQVG